MIDQLTTPVAGAEGMPAADTQAIDPATGQPDPLKLKTPDTVDTTQQPPADDKAEKKDGDPDPEEKPADKARKTFKYNARISSLNEQRRAAEMRAEAAEAELRRLRQPITRKPIEEMDYEERERLRTREAFRAERFEELQPQLNEMRDVARGAVHETVVAKVEAAEERMPGLQETLLKIPLTEETVDFLADSDKAPELVYYLDKNPDIAQQLFRMTFTGDDKRRGTATRASLNEAARMLGRLEAKLEAAPTARKATKAPPPGTHLNGNSPPAAATLRELSDQGRTLEYMAARQKAWAEGKR